MHIFAVIFRIVFIVFFFGFCIFIHEFGHLLVALWQGLKVEKFSIGFGKKIFGFQWRGVDFAVSLLPFGGYVMLPQLDPSDHPKTTAGEELPLASAKSRALTAFAGPFFNVLFGFVLATIMYFVGLWVPAPATSVTVLNVPEFLPPTVAQCSNADYVPEVNPEWAAGLRPGDKIIAVNGKGFTHGIKEFREEYLFTGGGIVTLTILRDDAKFDISYMPAPNAKMENLGYPFFEMCGPLMVGYVVPESPADLAGLRTGDIILALDGQVVSVQPEVTSIVRNGAGGAVMIDYSRDGVEYQVSITPKQVAVDGENVWQLGVGLSNEQERIIGHPSPWKQCSEVYAKTARTLGLLFMPLARRVHNVYSNEKISAPRTGIKLHHMSGPLGIVTMLWMTLEVEGLRGGMAFIILITFSLAFMNLLPLPVLDGGHILQAAIEAVIRRRMPVKCVAVINNVFAALLIALMLYITAWDGCRVYKLNRGEAGEAKQVEQVENMENGENE